MLPIIAQAQPAVPENPTVDGVLIVILMALAAVAPAIFREVLNLLKSLTARINAKTNAQITEMEGFKFLTDEIAYLRSERNQLEKGMAEVNERAEKLDTMLRELQEKMETMQSQVNTLMSDNLRYKEENDTLKARVSELEKQVDQLTAERDELKNRLEPK